MITAEDILDRKAALEGDLSKQRHLALQAASEISDAQSRLNNANAMIHSLSGAIQDCNFFLSKCQAPQEAVLQKPNGLATQSKETQ